MIQISPQIYWIGVNDRTSDLFESFWPLPEGVSYNSYLLVDERTVLFDTVKSNFSEEFIDNLRAGLDGRELDYLVVHHMEPDHSGSIPLIRELYPDVRIICTSKAEGMLKRFYGIDSNVKVIEDEGTLGVGERKLKFFETPFVHWPETMMSYVQSDGVLFPCDAFGGFSALDGGIFDDDIRNLSRYEDEILRYFSNIVGKYSATVQAALRKLEDIDIDVVAPSHGPIWRDQPETIVDLYGRWSRMEGDSGVTLIYGSMYGNTKKLMEEVARGVQSAGCVDLKVMDASRTHLSYLLSEAWKREGLLIGAPTYDGRIFPPVGNFIDILERKQLRNRVAGVFGSHGWAGGGVDRIKEAMDDLRWEVLQPVVDFGGRPTGEDLSRGRELGKKIGKTVMED